MEVGFGLFAGSLEDIPKDSQAALDGLPIPFPAVTGG